MHSISQHECKENAHNRNTANAFQTTMEQPSRTVVHAKLEMTTPDSPEEVEADAAANDIVQGGKIARSILVGGSGGGMAVSSQMEGRLNSLQGGGHVMPDGLRSMMERGFNRDFSQVHLHTDSEAASLSSSIHAKAFTHGNDIYFNQGQFSPNTSEGQKLMAHELTHVVQGRGMVARERDKNAENFIVDQYFYNSWNWTAFFTFLSNYYPSVVKDMKLEKDVDLEWEKDCDEGFLNNVVFHIIKVEEKRENERRVAGNSAYRNAMQSVIIMFSNPPSSQLYKPFMAMAKIAKNYQQNFADNTEYFHKLQTVSYAEAKKSHVEGAPLKDVSFDGKNFDNRSNMQKDVYNATRLLNENIANKYFEEESDVPEHGIEFRKQIENFASEWVDYEYDKYRQENPGVNKTLSSMIPTFVRLKNEMQEKYKNVSNQGQKDVIMMIYMLVDNREKNLYVSHIDTSNLVPARVWTNIFMTTMKNF